MTLRLFAGPHNFLDLYMESYYEVVAPPHGEGLVRETSTFFLCEPLPVYLTRFVYWQVGKKFMHPFFIGCRADGGEEYCTGRLLEEERHAKWPSYYT